ncbi:MAG: TRAP transporter substrate-binding protein DctP [Roseomonas sp.]|jgi:TRAP-type C4-dicarboxylate transport system substrate-binding protein|nr:TRAP transporter substrate-binding protein DctP [Roseomonas sp.]MCA3416207.1 TRAP transporter substrate-binding protein DctP [Roseomonas sp.]
MTTTSISRRRALAGGAAGLSVALIGTKASAQARAINLRIASGHTTAALAYVGVADSFFIPEVVRRSRERGHPVTFTVSWGGAVTRVNETLEAVQNGVVDVGLFLATFEAARLFSHNWHPWVPFAPDNNALQIKVTHEVYERVPFLRNVFEQRFGQRMIAVSGAPSVDLATRTPWNRLEDLRGRRIAGAGALLNFLRPGGIVGVQGSLADFFTSAQSGVVDGVMTVTAGKIAIRLYEVNPHLHVTRFGASGSAHITVNSDRWRSLPRPVQDTLQEVASEWQIKTAEENDRLYATAVDQWRTFPNTTVSYMSDETRLAWAQALSGLPLEQAREADRRGMPGSQILRTYMERLEANNFRLPITYPIA